MSQLSVAWHKLEGGFAQFSAGVTANANAATSVGAVVPPSIVSDIKQGASNALAIGEVIADNGIDLAAAFVEALVDGLAVKLLGPLATPVTLADHALLSMLAGVLKSVIDNRVLAIQAKAGLPAPAISSALVPNPPQL